MPSPAAVARSCHALGHPVRAAIVSRLASGEVATFADIEAWFPGERGDRLYYHLRRLRDAGLLSCRTFTPRDQPYRRAYYWIDRDRLPGLVAALTELGTIGGKP